MKHIRKFNEANIEGETLEEAAEKYSKQFDYAEDSSPQIDFIEGAKYMAERMYSEEEVIGLCMNAYNQATKDGSGAWLGTFDKWFEQNKKK